MDVNKTTSYTLTDSSINRIEGMIIGLGESELDAARDFISKATEMRKLSEENIYILNNLIEKATKLIDK